MKRKIFMKRAQSRGNSGFARVLTMLTLMLTFAVTGAWAQENEGWLPGVTNGDFSGDDVSSFFKKEYPSTETVPVVIDANAGKDGTPGIVVKTANDENSEPASYDSQFFIVLPEEMSTGTIIRVQFDYKASKVAKASTEFQAAPQSYLDWNAIGDVNFTTEWKTFYTEVTVSRDADGMKSIAFNLQHELTATDYYFDNFIVSYKKFEWSNIIVNSDLEGTDVSCFYVKEQGGETMFLPRITEGIGMDGSRAIKLQSSDNEPNSWDTQFHIRLPYVLPAGTMYRLSFDYKADKAGDFGFQVANEPYQYIWWTLDSWPAPGGSFTTKWQHYKKVFIVPKECDGISKSGDDYWLMQFRTIYANLSANKVATEFIFDNVKVEILSDVLSTLTPEPVTDLEHLIMAPPYTVTLAEGTEDADKWTITPAEATTTGMDMGTKVTLKYSGTCEVKSIMAALKAVNTGGWAEDAIDCTSNDLGKVLCTDGSIYETVTDATTAGKTAAAMIVVINAETKKGLALALADETSKMNYTVASGVNGAAAHTPTVTGGTWMLPSKDQWDAMITAAGGIAALRDGFTSVGGTNIDQNAYWSSTLSGSKAYYLSTNNGSWGTAPQTNNAKVRACLEFDVFIGCMPTPTTNANEWEFEMPAGDVELEIEYDTTPTGIESISSNTTVNNAKAAWYNLNGQRVAQPTKGLYIKDGKKVLVK